MVVVSSPDSKIAANKLPFTIDVVRENIDRQLAVEKYLNYPNFKRQYSCSDTSLGTFAYPYTSSNPLIFYTGTGTHTYTFLQPSYDSVNCILEPDPDFNGGAISSSTLDCANDLSYYNSATQTWNCPWDVNYLSSWLTTDGIKIVVDTNLAPESTTVYQVTTDYWLWCACSGSSYTWLNLQSQAWFSFQIKTARALTSVTSTEFSSNYTVYVGSHEHVYFPTFTADPSSTVGSYSNLGLIIDGITYYSSGTQVSPLYWPDIYSDYFCFAYVTLEDAGTHSFQVSWTWSDNQGFSQVFTYSFSVIIAACEVTTATSVSTMISSTSYTIFAASQTIALSLYTYSSTCQVFQTDTITYSSTLSGTYTSANSLTWLTFDSTSLTISSSDLQLAGTTVYLKQTTNWGGNYSQTSNLEVNFFNPPCSQSHENITLSVVTPAFDQKYVVGSALVTSTIAQFSQDSVCCNSNDIVYSLTVTPLTYNMSTSFIMFNANTRKVSWYTDLFEQVGQYTITVFAKITAASTFISSTQFTLTVSENACQYSKENIELTPNSETTQLTYLIGSIKGQEIIVPFTLNSTNCTQKDIVYSMDVTPSKGLSFIKFNSTTLEVTWQQIDNLFAGVYSVVVTGTVTSAKIVSNSTAFTIVAWFFTEPKVVDQEYTANNQLFQFMTGPFFVTPNSHQNSLCSNKPVAFLASQNLTAPIDTTKLEQLPPWLQFQQEQDGSGVFSVLTNGKDLKDTYIVAVVLQFSDSQQTLGFTQFNLKIKQVVNLPPVFLTSLQSSYNATCSSVLQLPAFADPEMTPVTLYYFFGSAKFLQGDQQGAIQIEKDCPTGTYLVSVSLIDQDGYKSQFNFNLVFDNLQTNSSLTVTTQKQILKAKEFLSIFGEKIQQPQRNSAYSPPKILSAPITIQSVSNIGLATFKFGASIIVPNFTSPAKLSNKRILVQLQDYITPKILSLKMSNGEGNEVALLNWTAINLTESFLKVQIFFSTPIDVSTQDYDFLKAEFLNTDIFVLKNGLGFLFNEPSDQVTNAAKIPPQYLNKAAAEAAQKQIESLQGASYTTITITLIIQLVGKKLISFVWLFFCAIQVIIFLNQHVNYNLPATAYTTISALNDIISLNAFNKDEALEKIGAKEVIKSPLFHNLGGIAFLAVILIIAIVIVGIMMKFCNRPFCQQIVKKIKGFLLWNFVIRYFYAVFLNFFFSSIVSIKSEDATIADIVISSLILTALLSIVFGFIRLLVQLDRGFLEMSNVKRSFGMLYTNLKTQKLSTRLYNQTFFFQRMALALIVAFKLDFGIQAGLLQFSILMHTIYLLGVRPYQTIECALPDILNEVFLILTVVLLICLSPWQTDNMIRYQIGHALTALIGFFFMLNFGVIFIRLGSENYKKTCMKMYKKKVQKKHIQLIKERMAEIELRLRKIAKRSGLVQFTELDDAKDPRPHINQLSFAQVINTKQMFQQIEKIALQRALINSNNGIAQPSKQVQLEKSNLKDKNGRAKSKLHNMESKVVLLREQVMIKPKTKAVSKASIQKLQPQQQVIQINLQQKLQNSSLVTAKTKSKKFQDTKNEQRWNLICDLSSQQNELVNTVNQAPRTYYFNYLNFMDRQFEQRPHQQPIVIGQNDNNQQNIDSYRNQYGYSDEKLLESSPAQLHEQTPRQYQHLKLYNSVLNKPIGELKDRKQIRALQLQQKPFESQLVFGETQVIHERFKSKVSEFGKNHNDEQQDKPIWLQN